MPWYNGLEIPKFAFLGCTDENDDDGGDGNEADDEAEEEDNADDEEVEETMSSRDDVLVSQNTPEQVCFIYYIFLPNFQLYLPAKRNCQSICNSPRFTKTTAHH